MYSSIPITETRKFLEDIAMHSLGISDLRHKLLNLYDVITEQNYFLNNNNVIIQKDSLTMAAPSSSILSEIFIKHIEHTHLPRLTHKHKFINYFRYVDDILLICDASHTDIHTILDDFSSIHKKPTIHRRSRTKQST